MDLPPPYTWRADGGYQPPPSTVGPAPVQQCLPSMLCFCTLPAHPIVVHQQNFTIVPSQPQHQVFYQQPAAQLPRNLPPAPPSSASSSSSPPAKKKQKTEPRKQEKQKDGAEKERDAAAPPSLRPGTKYMFPPKSEHTSMHIFNRAARIWEDRYKGQAFDFKIFNVGTHFTVNMVIENVVGKRGDDAKGWAATEVFERGSGVWSRGSSIEYKSDKAKGTLGSMGWTAKRGESLPPVWVVVHKMPAEKK